MIPVGQAGMAILSVTGQSENQLESHRLGGIGLLKEGSLLQSAHRRAGLAGQTLDPKPETLNPKP